MQLRNYLQTTNKHPKFFEKRVTISDFLKSGTRFVIIHDRQYKPINKIYYDN